MSAQPARISATWRILEGRLREASVGTLYLVCTNGRESRWGPARWAVYAHGGHRLLAEGEVWQHGPEYSSLVRQAMLEAERAAARHLEL